MDSMDEAYAKSQKRIQEARQAQKEVEYRSEEWERLEKIVLHEMWVWN